MIHGGLKYAVGGKLNDSSEALSAMPERWSRALRGEGNVDLSKVEILSDHQILWSLPGMMSKMVSFFGSKALRGRADSISRKDFPEVFDSPQYKGNLFRIGEKVVDPVSLVKELARSITDITYLVDWENNAELVKGSEGISHIAITENDGKTASLQASHYVFAAGAGNAGLLECAGKERPQMQLRPLHQLVIRKQGLPDFFSVCIGHSPKPPLVSTTHVDSQGRRLWYIGGDIAEAEGVVRNESDQISAGKVLFQKVMPWINLQGADWFTVRVDRAEPDMGTGDRPSGAYCEEIGNNTLVAWPTKLALAPDLADKITTFLKEPQHPEVFTINLPTPNVGQTPWDLE